VERLGENLREAGVWLMFRRYWRRSRLSEDYEDEELGMPDLSDEDGKLQGSMAAVKANPTRQSRRASAKKVSYAEADGLPEDEKPRKILT